ncbi:spectrin beta chain, erythrocytic [Caerostris darwini]|uniref:Spectrin beta chain, erythrocytic n=1 Tax=Caerostris darwini TaxID=1538125 RepID=A0AAV4MSF3_9ARAC|nr:spectrin beta chain, erythrocytic [Caerostris darwini]
MRLMKLLESLTGEKLGKPAKGSARINKIENVSRCLAFLHSKKMRLENISSEDIVDGKPHLILGLIWTIILRCEIWQNQQNVNSIVPQIINISSVPISSVESPAMICLVRTCWSNVLLLHCHTTRILAENSSKFSASVLP